MALTSPLEIGDLRLARAVSDQGSLTAAGRELHLTQSALSHRLVALERRLGVRLFVRAGRRMVPTVAGERLLATARETLAALRRTEEDLRHLAAGTAGVLRLGAECQTTYRWLPSVLAQLRARHPGVDVQIAGSASRRPAEAVLTGALDIGLVWCPPADPRLSARALFDDRMVLLVPAAHPLATLPRVTPRAVDGEHLIVYGLESVRHSPAAQAMARSGARPRRVSRVQLTEAIVELVRAGVGISIVADWAADEFVAQGGVASIPLEGDGFARTWYAVRRSEPDAPPYHAAFVELLAAHAPAMGAHRG